MTSSFLLQSQISDTTENNISYQIKSHYNKRALVLQAAAVIPKIVFFTVTDANMLRCPPQQFQGNVPYTQHISICYYGNSLGQDHEANVSSEPQRPNSGSLRVLARGQQQSASSNFNTGIKTLYS